MTNIDATLQAIFVDTDTNEVVDSLNQTNQKDLSLEMPLSSFREKFLKRNSLYGSDVVNKIFALSNDYWLTNSNDNSKNVFNALSVATKGMLIWEKDEPLCKYEEYLRWNDISSIIDEDLLVTAFLAQKSVNERFNLNSFAWKPHIISKNLELNEILNKGLYELHFHMQGSSLCFFVNWLVMMNYPYNDKYKNALKKLNNDVKIDIIRARAARYYLFRLINNKASDIDYQQLIKTFKSSNSSISISAQYFENKISVAGQESIKYGNSWIDYALTYPITELDKDRYYNVPLAGERKLLYLLLREIYSGGAKTEKILIPLYIYVLAKNKVCGVIHQNNDIKGFSNFQDFEKRKNSFIFKDSIYEKLYSFMSFQNTVCNQPLKYLEMRITPKDDIKELTTSLRNLNAAADSSIFRLNKKNNEAINQVKAGFILHFIKKDEGSQKDNLSESLLCRNHSVRSSIEKQADVIAEMVGFNSIYINGSNHPTYANKRRINPIIGIDAANSEFCCRPEVFGPVFRRLSNIPRNQKHSYFFKIDDCQLGRTFHVGEDFYDIIDGLRAIDECIYYLNFGQGDRLGHAVALGVNAYEYYKCRRFNIVLPKQVLLDNVVWLLKKMGEYSISDKNGLQSRLISRFNILFNEIYQDETASIDEYYYSWQLRGDQPTKGDITRIAKWKPYVLNRIEPHLDTLRNNNRIVKLFKKYHYSPEVKRNGERCVEFTLKDSDAFIIAELQEKMRNYISSRKISIETNPTSNIRITDVDRYSKHPILSFNNYGLINPPHTHQIDVSINTDDQGVFATSIEKEFTLMACALEKKRNEDGSATYKPKDIYKWLDTVRETAKRNSFLN